MSKKFGLSVAIILFVLAFGLYILLFRFVLLEIAYRLFTGGTTAVKEYLYRVARSVDQTGNATYPVTWTILFIQWWTKERYEFGNEDVTISEVLHRNKLQGKLSYVGRVLWELLEWLDPGHGERAVEETCL